MEIRHQQQRLFPEIKTDLNTFHGDYFFVCVIHTVIKTRVRENKIFFKGHTEGRKQMCSHNVWFIVSSNFSY